MNPKGGLERPLLISFVWSIRVHISFGVTSKASRIYYYFEAMGSRVQEPVNSDFLVRRILFNSLQNFP